MLEIQQVCFTYDREAFYSFDLTVQHGEFIALRGSSGAGKTTLLHLLGGFLKPLSGDLQWKEQSFCHLPPHKRPVFIIFQKDNLFSHLTAWQNIAIALSHQLRPNEKMREQINWAMEEVDIKHLAQRKPHQLSVGQQQRVAIARMLVCDKPVVLMDEPVASLDSDAKLQLLSSIKNLAKRNGLTVIFTTHDKHDTERLEAREVYLEDGKLSRFKPKINPKID